MSVSTLRQSVYSSNVPRDNTPPTENQKIARVVRTRASNMFEVETPEKTILLMLIPDRFRRSVWVKLGDFAVVEPIQEDNKVKVEMVKLLTIQQIWRYKMDNMWPKEFKVYLSYLCVKWDKSWINPSKPNDADSSSDSEDSSSDSSETETCGSDYSSDSTGDSNDEET